MMALPIFQLGSNVWTGAWVSWANPRNNFIIYQLINNSIYLLNQLLITQLMEKPINHLKSYLLEYPCICLSVYLYICKYVYMPMCVSVYLSICQSVYLSI